MLPPTVSTLRPAKPSDATAIAAIHADGLRTGHASFRRDPYGWTEWQTAFGTTCALVAEREGTVIGWAGVAAASDRCVYAGVGEVSVYVSAAAWGQGIGRHLLVGLIATAEAAGYWTLVAQMFPENRASQALHATAGFRRVGVRERLGRMGYGPYIGTWRDVILMERRSNTVGNG